MILKNPTSLRSITLEPDCAIVIGSGAVGTYLGVQLARRGRQVVVLESGDRSLGGFGPESFAVVGRACGGIRLARSRSLGGTSNLWGGQLVEFLPIDFDGRGWLPGSRWPVRYDEIAPFYGPTYEALGIEPSMQRDDPVWRELKKPRVALGEGLEVFLTRWMRVPNVAAHFGADVESSDRLLVVLGATAVGFEAAGDRITGVIVVDEQGNRSVVRGGDVVLAAGTIENARLLLHARDDDSWRCPWRCNDNIGRRFQDHLGGRIAYIRPRDDRSFFDVFCTIVLRGYKFQPKVRVRDEVQRREESLNVQGFIAFESSVQENLVYLKQFMKAALQGKKNGSVREFARHTVACWRHMLPLMWKFVVEHRVLIPSGSKISLFVQSEVQPVAESRITIDPTTRDRYGLPKVILDWRLSGRELADIAAFGRRVGRALSAAELAELELEPELAAGDPAFLERLVDTYHQAGGCCMGASPADGVVDRDLRVFGTPNLYVAGACVFPTSSNANTTFTAMTFATRLAEHLTKRGAEHRGRPLETHHAAG
ncbi:MAG: GMC family oxidoreductase [Phycisphaerales bacterium]